MDGKQIGAIAFVVARFIIENEKCIERIAKSIDGTPETADVILGLLNAGKDTVTAMLDFIDEYGDSNADD